MASISVVAPIFLQWSMHDDEFIRGNPFNNLFDAHGIIKQVIIELQVGPSKPLHDLFDSIFPRLEGSRKLKQHHHNPDYHQIMEL
jgi:hypothetical protein